MERRTAVVLSSVILGLAILGFGFMLMLGSVFAAFRSGGDEDDYAGRGTGGAIGIVELTGTIEDSRDVVAALGKMRRDKDVRAVVLRIDSPGGAVGPSQEIHRAIGKLREKKRVIASLGSVAASGGYYAAVACEKIVANPGTITASIGVITQLPDFVELAKMAHVQWHTFKSGALKDSGNPFRELLPADRKMFEDLIASIYEQFLGAVAQGRKIPIEKLRPIADGRVMTGLQAKALGLVDELGNEEDAIQLAAKLTGLGDDPRIVRRHRSKPFLRQMLEGSAQSAGQALARGITSGITNSVKAQSSIAHLLEWR